jgi:hypothetical protein
VRFGWLLALALGCAGTSNYEIETVLAKPQADHYVEPPRALAQKPWKIGQWTQYKIQSAKRLGYVKHRVVGEARCGWWFETVVVFTDYEDRTVFKVCMRDMPDYRLELDEQRSMIGAYMTRRGDKTEARDLGEGRNQRARDTVVRMLEGFAMFARRGELEEGNSEVEVRAGQFTGVVRFPARIWLDDEAHAATIYYHPEVPLGGIVKAIAYDEDDQKVLEIELLDYGFEGARSELPDFNHYARTVGLADDEDEGRRRRR